MKSYIAVVANTTQNQPNYRNSQPSPDWWVLALVGVSGFCAQYLPKIGSALMNSPITNKVIGAQVAEKLTQNTIELQEAEARVDERESYLNMIRDVLAQSQAAVSEQQREVLSLFKMAMEQQKIHAEAAQTQSAIASRIEAIASSIADAITTLNLTTKRSNEEVAKELKKVSEGQELAQEHLASGVAAIINKIEVMLQNQDDLKNGNRILEANLAKAIADLKIELATAIASLG